MELADTQSRVEHALHQPVKGKTEERVVIWILRHMREIFLMDSIVSDVEMGTMPRRVKSG